jgi:hypothetical protein
VKVYLQQKTYLQDLYRLQISSLESLLERRVVSDSLKLLAVEIFPRKKMHGHSATLVRVKCVGFSVMKTPGIAWNKVDS